MNSLKQKDSIKKKKQKQQKEHVLLYKLLYSFMTMLVYMVGRNIPLYGIDIDAYSNVNVDAQSILLQAISGDMKNCSIFIIGLWPYMLASMLAILIVAIMSLDHTRKLSPKKINIWTVTIMMIIAAVQAYHKTQTLMYRVSGYELILNKIIVFIQLIAGMLIVVYMCDRATKYGMSGTLMDAKDELFETYGKHVVRIPTNRPLKRVDRKDRYFKNGHDQFWTAVDDVIRLHETGQPVLVVLNSVTDTDLFSRLLIEKNIPHNVLNASNAFWEAQIIAGAGQMNAVTVATTMAGRGTDIKLGDGVKELGGLAVIGIGRMNNSRSERQARGRAGRQGDPGFSQYYVSLEDDIVGAEDDDKLQRYIDGKKRIGKRKIKRIVNQCQKLSVESEEMNRKKSLQYDQVLQRQRDLIYATRKKLLDGASVEEEKIVEIAKGNISDFVNHFDCIQSNNKHGRRRGRKKDNDKNTNTEQYTSMLNRYILDNISYKLDTGLSRSDMESAATVSDYLMLRVYQGLSRQRERIGDEEAYEQFVREATLKAVDDGWVELIDYLEQLKYAVAGRASAQRNVMFEYQNEAFESFLDSEKAVKFNIIRNILLSDVKIGKDGRLQVIYP